MRNLFVIHSPFQKFVTEQLVQNDPELRGDENHLLIETDHPGCREVRAGLWREVHRLDVIGYSVLGRSRHHAAERNLARVHELVARGGRTRVFLSDIAWPFNNRVFFDRKLKKRVEYRLFIDGIGSYSGIGFTRRLHMRNAAKFVLGRLGGAVRYTPYIGGVMGGFHPRITRVHGFSAHLLACPREKQVELPFHPPETLAEGNSCLFLDQSYWQRCDPAEWRAFQEQTRDYLLSLGCDVYFYKKHAHGRPEDDAFFAEAGFRIIEDGRCVEEMFHDLGASVVVSYNSSALFNIKSFYGERVRCISWCSDHTARMTHTDAAGMRRLKELFELVGVEVMEEPAQA